MRIGLVCYCLGIWVGTLLHVSVLQYSFPLLLFCFFAFATVAFFVLSKYFKPASLSFITARFMLFSLAFLIGISWHGVWAFNRLTERLPFEFENEDLIVVGKVVGLPQRTDRMQKFEFIVDAGSSVVVTRKLQLNYFGNEVIRGGQTWEFVVRLKQPRGFSNVGGFDFEAWALQNRISATGYVRTPQD